MGNTAARDKLINTVKTRLENWLKAVQGENASPCKILREQSKT